MEWSIFSLLGILVIMYATVGLAILIAKVAQIDPAISMLISIITVALALMGLRRIADAIER